MEDKYEKYSYGGGETPSVLCMTLLYNNYSYGCMLQALALYSTLTKLGFEVTELNYRNAETSRKAVVGLLKNAIMHPIHKGIPYIMHRIERRRYLHQFPNEPLKTAFELFKSEHFRMTELRTPSTLTQEKRYDFYVTGGDQVWNPDWTDDKYYLGWADGKRISFSASAGKDALDVEELKYIADHLYDLNAISVREHSLAERLREIGIEAIRVFDPVFLLTKADWDRFVIEHQNDAPYVFVFLLSEEKDIRKKLQTLRGKIPYRVIAFSHLSQRINPYDNGYADEYIHGANPLELVGYIKNALFIVTDSFHCLSMSLIYNKQVVVIDRFLNSGRTAQSSRVKDMLDDIGIRNIIIENDDVPKIDVDREYIDYQQITPIIQNERNKSLAFIYREMAE